MLMSPKSGAAIQRNVSGWLFSRLVAGKSCGSGISPKRSDDNPQHESVSSLFYSQKIWLKYKLSVPVQVDTRGCRVRVHPTTQWRAQRDWTVIVDGSAWMSVWRLGQSALRTMLMENAASGDASTCARQNLGPSRATCRGSARKNRLKNHTEAIIPGKFDGLSRQTPHIAVRMSDRMIMN